MSIQIIALKMPKDKNKSQNRPHRARSSSTKRERADDSLKEDRDSKRPNTVVSVEPEKSTTVMEEDYQLLDKAMEEIADKVGDCVDTQSEMVTTLNDHSERLVDANKEISELKAKNRELNKKYENMDAALKAALDRIGDVEKTANMNAHNLKNSNLVIDGLKEIKGEDCRQICLDVFKELEDKCQLEDILTAYRIGEASKDGKYERPMVVKMSDPLIKAVLMENKGKLVKHERYAKIYLNDDLPPELKKQRKTLREISKFAYSIGYKNCKASGSKLTIEGKTYRYETLHLLPQDLQLCNIRTRRVGDGIGFQGEVSYLSNFYPATFNLEEYTFVSAEQAYQFFKVRTCKRDDSAMQIMGMSKSRKIKEAGDSIPATAVWEANKEKFMRSIAYSKFSQNKDIRMKLLATMDVPLYECTKNRWWGCGFHLDDPEWKDRAPPGLNKMGEILMDVRSALRKKEFKADAILKSPSAIIKTMQRMDEQIKEKAMRENTTLTPIEQNVESMETQESEISSASDTDDLMDQTETEEESVDISATSNTSTGSGNTSRLSARGKDGKLDISRIRSWKIPKLLKMSDISGKETPSAHVSTCTTRSQKKKLRDTLPSDLHDVMKPKAQSTPDSNKPNRSLTLQRVREKLNKSGKK